MPISGTPPMTSNPYQLASQLAISGHLDTIFGGLHQYLTDYCTVDQYGRFSPPASGLSSS